NNVQCGEGECDANRHDRVGHCSFDLLAQTRAGFEESGKALQNFREQTAAFARFHHADEESIENARMLRDRFMKCFAALYACRYIADDMAQGALAPGIGLVVKRGPALDQ